MNNGTDRRDGDANRDPISGAPGVHPVGTGVGAASGAVVGGLAGKGVAEAIQPTRKDVCWRENHDGRSFVESGSSFDDGGPAHGVGVSSFGRVPGRSFEDV